MFKRRFPGKSWKTICQLIFIIALCTFAGMGCKKDVNTSAGEEVSMGIEDKMIDNSEAEKILRYMNFEIDGHTISSTDITSLRIDEHLVNKELKTDTVLAEYTAEKGKRLFEFSANVVFEYDDVQDVWTQTGYSINPDYIISYIKSYRFELSAEEIVTQLNNERFGIEVMGTTYYSDENEIGSVKYGKVEPDGSDYLYVNLDFTLLNENIEIGIDARTEFKYTADRGWVVYFVDETAVKSVKCNATGIWTGSYSDGKIISVEIKDSLNEYDELSAYVEIRKGDNEEFSFNASVNEFLADATRGDYMSLKNIGWIKRPNDDNLSQWQVIYGRINEGVWTVKCNSESLKLSK